MESTLKNRSDLLVSQEDFEPFFAQFGQGCRFTQVDAGTFGGSYFQQQWEGLNTLSFSFSAAACVRQPCLPDIVVLGRLLSETPIKINGRFPDQNGFFVLFPGSNVCMTTMGPATLHALLAPESGIEADLADTWSAIKNNISDTAVILPDMDEQTAWFANWYSHWLSNPFEQDAQAINSLSRQVSEVLHSMLQRIGEDWAVNADRLQDGKMKGSQHGILKLIDYFYQHPELPLSTAEMSAIAGLNRRSLFHHFKSFTGYSPHHFFRYIRLQAVRQSLLRDADSVSWMAQKFNFHHHGEFSELYKNCYGELPSETRLQTLARLSGSA